MNPFLTVFRTEGLISGYTDFDFIRVVPATPAVEYFSIYNYTQKYPGI